MTAELLINLVRVLESALRPAGLTVVSNSSYNNWHTASFMLKLWQSSIPIAAEINNLEAPLPFSLPWPYYLLDTQSTAMSVVRMFVQQSLSLPALKSSLTRTNSFRVPPSLHQAIPRYLFPAITRTMVLRFNNV